MMIDERPMSPRAEPMDHVLDHRTINSVSKSVHYMNVLVMFPPEQPDRKLFTAINTGLPQNEGRQQGAVLYGPSGLL